jgi:putative two-component system response regulator
MAEQMDNDRAKVMVVDDSIVDLKVAINALTKFCDVFPVQSAKKMFDLLKHNKPHLILLDITMPEINGLEAIQTLKANPDTQDIPVIFLTGQDNWESEFKGLSLGAIDYISKPFMPKLLQKRVELHLTVEAQKLRLEEQADKLKAQGEELKHFNENLQVLVHERTGEVITLQNAILKTVADLVESRDNATGGHVERTQHGLKTLMNGLMELDIYGDLLLEWDLDLMLQSSQLHDVGKIAIPDSILNKPGRLTAEEFETIKTHVLLGVKIIERIENETPSSDFLKYAKIFAKTHHEKWDGSGYPYGLVRQEIPLPGQLLAIADVYDALTSERPYKKAFPHSKAVQVIVEGKGSYFDPVLVDVFKQVADQFVLLS